MSRARRLQTMEFPEERRRRQPREVAAVRWRRQQPQLAPGGDDWDACVAQFLKHRGRYKADQTVKNDRHCLGWMARRLELVGCPVEPTAVERKHVEALIDGMREGSLGRLRLKGGAEELEAARTVLSGRTINLKLQSWRLFFRFLTEERLIAVDPMERIGEVEELESEIEWLKEDEIQRLVRHVSACVRRIGTFNVLRDYVCLLVQLDTGMRPGELLRLNVADVDLHHATIRVHSSASKTKSWRDLHLVPGVAAEVAKYLRERNAQEFDCPQLFCSSEGNRRRDGTVKPLLLCTYVKALGRYAEGANLGKRVTGYTLRHTFARQYLLNGGQLAELQSLLGHDTDAQVLRYSRLWGIDLQNAHDRHSPMRRFG